MEEIPQDEVPHDLVPDETSGEAPSGMDSLEPVPEEESSFESLEAGILEKLITGHLPLVFSLFSKFEAVYSVVAAIAHKLVRIYNFFYAQFEDKLPDQIVKCATGFVLMFFGGFFINTVAVIHAFEQSGSERLFASLRELREELRAAEYAIEEEDLSGKGIGEMLQFSETELSERQLDVAMRACDPHKIKEALHALYLCLLATAATLHFQLARTISLGAAIGDRLYKPISKHIIPVIERHTDPDYHKWIPTIFQHICRSIGTSIAFTFQRILSTITTAVHGGHMVMESTSVLAEHFGKSFFTNGIVDDLIVWGLVLVGIYFQIFVFSYLPTLVKLALLPFFIVEYILTAFLATVPP